MERGVKENLLKPREHKGTGKKAHSLLQPECNVCYEVIPESRDRGQPVEAFKATKAAGVYPRVRGFLNGVKGEE